ncbi:MAG: hypothetical protein JXJ04_01540 [Spirochaetales bacterium]|nr:hypothetical protein [Spirochaetales bacterium]
MSITNVHDFHFVMDRGMKDKLRNLGCVIKSTSLSGIIVTILKTLIPVIRKEHKWGEQRMSRYKAVCSDAEEIRDQLRLMHNPCL